MPCFFSLFRHLKPKGTFVEVSFYKVDIYKLRNNKKWYNHMPFT